MLMETVLFGRVSLVIMSLEEKLYVLECVFVSNPEMLSSYRLRRDRRAVLCGCVVKCVTW